MRDSLLVAEIEAHEAVHREQAAAHGSCDAFLATLTSARRVIDAELPAYCAQWKVAVARGADSATTRREFAWRIAAQSGAMENRLQVAQRFEAECRWWPSGGPGRALLAILALVVLVWLGARDPSRADRSRAAARPRWTRA